MLRRGGRRGMLRRMWCATAAHSQSSWRRARQRGGNSHVLRRSTGTAPIAELSLFIAPFAELSLFVAPVGRTMAEFLSESNTHGWPSFRDSEVVWENMRVLKSTGEAVSADGTHLGHNLPDKRGNRYCINLVSVAGRPVDKVEL